MPTGTARIAGEHRGPAVLRDGLAVAPDAVDAVGAALDLRHRGGHRQQREAEAEDEGDLAGLLRLVGLLDRRGEGVLLACTGRQRVDDVGDDRGRPLLVEVGGEPGQGEQERHDRQAGLQGERAAVGEPVAVAEPHERLDRDVRSPCRRARCQASTASSSSPSISVVTGTVRAVVMAAP